MPLVEDVALVVEGEMLYAVEPGVRVLAGQDLVVQLFKCCQAFGGEVAVTVACTRPRCMGANWFPSLVALRMSMALLLVGSMVGPC